MTQIGPAWLFDGSPIDDPRGDAAQALKFLSILRHPKSRKPNRELTFDDHCRPAAVSLKQKFSERFT